MTCIGHSLSHTCHTSIRATISAIGSALLMTVSGGASAQNMFVKTLRIGDENGAKRPEYSRVLRTLLQKRCGSAGTLTKSDLTCTKSHFTGAGASHVMSEALTPLVNQIAAPATSK